MAHDRTADQENFLVSLENALLARFGGGNDRLVAEANIKNSAHRAVAYDLFKYYGLKYKSIATKQLIEFKDDTTFLYSSDGELDHCWSCSTPSKMARHTITKTVLVDLPPNSQWIAKDRLTEEKEVPDQAFFGPAWIVHPGCAKNFINSGEFQSRVCKMIYKDRKGVNIGRRKFAYLPRDIFR